MPRRDRTTKSQKNRATLLHNESDSSPGLSGKARVNEGSYSFTCHPRVYPLTELAVLLYSL